MILHRTGGGGGGRRGEGSHGPPTFQTGALPLQFFNHPVSQIEPT